MITDDMSREGSSNSEYALAFETSSDWGSVALGRGGELIDSRTFSAPMRHAVEFLATVEAMCRTYDVSPSRVRRVYVSCGPGSFTGLRMGVTAARMMAMARRTQGGDELKVVAVPTLDVIAQNAFHLPDPPYHLVVILDAKRGRVYAATFVRHGDIYVAQTGPAELEPVALFSQQPRDSAVMGQGVVHHRQAVDESGLMVLPGSLYTPRAETVFELGLHLAGAGKFVEPKQLVPTYIRPPEAEEKWKQRHDQPLA